LPLPRYALGPTRETEAVRRAIQLGVVGAAVCAIAALVFVMQRPPTHNAADATYAASMVPHHALGVRMAELAVARADNVLVRRIAFKMQNYQKAELVSLEKWANGWNGKPGDHVHGMLSAQEERALASLDGPAFDRLFLTEMIRHHEGAITMSNDEIRNGRSGDARNVARLVVQVQQEQVDEMRKLLVDGLAA
jgi:uncharacterized protein (DUF305 family)